MVGLIDDRLEKDSPHPMSPEIARKAAINFCMPLTLEQMALATPHLWRLQASCKTMACFPESAILTNMLQNDCHQSR